MAEPSLRITTVNVFGDMPTTRTEYFCGLNTRFESRSCSGYSTATTPTNVRYEYGPLRAYIFNRDLGYRFELEPAMGIYTAFRVDEHGNPVWTKSGRIQLAKPSGKVVHNHTETIDTGERRKIFGYAARRVVSRSHETRDSQLLSESEFDGWYIDPPAALLRLHPPRKPGAFHHLSCSTGEVDDYKFSEPGKRETGFVLLAKRKTKSSFENATGDSVVRESVYRQEVTEFSETPLQRELFVPPCDFKRVLQLPDGIPYPLMHRIRLRWEMLRSRGFVSREKTRLSPHVLV